MLTVVLLRVGARLLLVLFYALLFSCASSTGHFTIYQGEVTRVHDGDSLHITPENSRRVVVRLAAIDAPELAQAFGIESRQRLRALVMNQVAEARCHKKDRYDRHVCTVYVGDTDINLQMLESGLAWHYVAFQGEQTARDRRLYAGTQASAKQNRTGLWAAAAVPPWEFRNQR